MLKCHLFSTNNTSRSQVYMLWCSLLSFFFLFGSYFQSSYTVIFLIVPFIGPFMQLYHSNSINKIAYSLALYSHLSCDHSRGWQLCQISGKKLRSKSKQDPGCCSWVWIRWWSILVQVGTFRLCQHLCFFDLCCRISVPLKGVSHLHCAPVPGCWVTSSWRVNKYN